MNNPMIAYQPTQGPGSYNYQVPTSGGNSVLPGVGSSYLDSMAQYGGSPGNTPGMDWNGLFGNINQGVGAFTALASLYGMFQNLGMQKKAFKFHQEGTKRNFNAQATAYNEAVASKETARHAQAAANGQDYGSMYAYGTGAKVDKWT